MPTLQAAVFVWRVTWGHDSALSPPETVLWSRGFKPLKSIKNMTPVGLSGAGL